MDFKDWKMQNQDPLKYWLSKLTNNQKALIVEVKNRFNWQIDGFSQIKRDELQIKIDMHISNRAKIELLERYHAEIINQTDFLEIYRDILDKETYAINDDKFNAFVMSFEVVGLSSPYVNDLAEIKAMEYLKNVATLNILEFIRNGIIENEISGNSRFKEIPEWQKVLAKLANRFHYDAPTVKFTILFHFMKRNKVLPEKFKQRPYMDYVRGTYLNNNGYTKMDFPEHEYREKVKPYESELMSLLEAP
ncbi:hypothetical protein [Maribacter aurantiacus]|uniref:Uncharacterized protein n=1 Tax=Maribacter aurantiacus TaxID=1882343 RepID=A0A5R8MBJ4_9FLAO|nr:hypothetical protein [Maribacter aurantiacus]TLF46924.1 hypothetical protein FEK29_03905 [Maribacter aurantiacus]